MGVTRLASLGMAIEMAATKAYEVAVDSFWIKIDSLSLEGLYAVSIILFKVQKGFLKIKLCVKFFTPTTQLFKTVSLCHTFQEFGNEREPYSNLSGSFI